MALTFCTIFSLNASAGDEYPWAQESYNATTVTLNMLSKEETEIQFRNLIKETINPQNPTMQDFKFLKKAHSLIKNGNVQAKLSFLQNIKQKKKSLSPSVKRRLHLTDQVIFITQKNNWHYSENQVISIIQKILGQHTIHFYIEIDTELFLASWLHYMYEDYKMPAFSWSQYYEIIHLRQEQKKRYSTQSTYASRLFIQACASFIAVASSAIPQFTHWGNHYRLYQWTLGRLLKSKALTYTTTAVLAGLFLYTCAQYFKTQKAKNNILNDLEKSAFYEEIILPPSAQRHVVS